jgi:hypothetical protein
MHALHHHAYLIGNRFIDARVYRTTDAQKAIDTIDAIRQGEHEALIIDAGLEMPFPGGGELEGPIHWYSSNRV